jgi:hypothetical protein
MALRSLQLGQSNLPHMCIDVSPLNADVVLFEVNNRETELLKYIVTTK